MNQSEAESLLGLLGSRAEKITFGKIIGRCPLARWTHSSGKDDSPSFAFIPVGDSYYGSCLACGIKAGGRGIVWKHMMLSRIANPKAMAIAYGLHDEPKEIPVDMLDYAVGGPDVGSALVKSDWATHEHNPNAKTIDMFGHKYTHRTVKGADYPAPTDDFMIRLQDEPVPEYFLERGYTLFEYVKWGLGHDVKNRRLVFPVRAKDGSLVGYTARTYWTGDHCFRCGTSLIVDDVKKKNCPKCSQSYVKYKHHPGTWRRTSAYGAETVQGQPSIIVEGTTDVLNLRKLGIAAPIAILGASPSPGQIQLISDLSKDIAVMGDGDVAGWQMNDEVSAMLTSCGVSVVKIKLPEGSDPGMINKSFAEYAIPSRFFT